jgi:predicted glutamine amidotransferase
MCELLAISSKFPTRATFSLEEFSRHGGQGGPNKDGWGLAFYEDGDAQIFREAEPAEDSRWMFF